MNLFTVALAAALLDQPLVNEPSDAAIVPLMLTDKSVWVGALVTPVTLPSAAAGTAQDCIVIGTTLIPAGIANRFNIISSGQWAAMWDHISIRLSNTVMTDADIDEVNRGYCLTFSRGGWLFSKMAIDGLIFAGAGTGSTTTGATPTRGYVAMPQPTNLRPNLGGLLPFYSVLDTGNLEVQATEAIAATVSNASIIVHGAIRKVTAAADPFSDIFGDAPCDGDIALRRSVADIIAHIHDAEERRIAEQLFGAATRARIGRVRMDGFGGLAAL